MIDLYRIDMKMERQLKASSFAVQNIIKEVIDLLRKGWSRKKIADHIMKKYDFTFQQASKYIHDAYLEIFEASNVVDLSKLKEQYIDRVESLLEQAIANGKIDQAIRIQDMLNKITGMYIEKQEVKVDSDNIKFKFDS